MEEILPELPSLFIVSDVKIGGGEEEVEFEDLDVSIGYTLAEGEKCERCWNYSTTVGQDKDHPKVCSRCSSVLKESLQ